MGYIIGLLFRYRLRHRPFGYVTLGTILVCWILLAYGYFIGQWKLVITPVEITHADLPAAFEGTKIVHISDLHLSTFHQNPQQLQRIVDSINAQHPDLICFTGDLVNSDLSELPPHLSTLRQLHARYGIYSVLGNHDFFIYGKSAKDSKTADLALEALCRYQRDSLQWNLLRNEHRTITAASGETITVVGVDNISSKDQGFHSITRGDLSAAMAGSDGFQILLSHDPGHWSEEVLPLSDIALTLSGHTHAAQIRIGAWTPARWMFSRTDGLYEEEGQSLYINIGLGTTAPFRIGANPEITVITLHRNSNKE